MQKFVTAPTPEMSEKILHPQISPSKTANHGFVHFPMNSNGKRKDAEPIHWTLLVLDQKEGDWWIKKKGIGYITTPYNQDLLKQLVITSIMHELWYVSLTEPLFTL